MKKANVPTSRERTSQRGTKGKVYFIKTSKGLYPLSVLKQYENEVKPPQGKTKQEKSDVQYMSENNLVPLPFSTDGLLFLQENCSYFDACVRQIGKDVAWPGYELYLRDEDGTEDDAEKKRVGDFLNDPNTEEENIQDIIEQIGRAHV